MSEDYLRILRRLVAMRTGELYAREMGDLGQKLVDNCIKAAFRECVSLGREAEARRLLAELKS